MKRKIGSGEDVIVERNDEDELNGKERKERLAGNRRKKKRHCVYKGKERETLIGNIYSDTMDLSPTS